MIVGSWLKSFSMELSNPFKLVSPILNLIFKESIRSSSILKSVFMESILISSILRSVFAEFILISFSDFMEFTIPVRFVIKSFYLEFASFILMSVSMELTSSIQESFSKELANLVRFMLKGISIDFFSSIL